MSSAEKRLIELLDYVLDGSCTDDQRSEFYKLIDETPELTPELAEQLYLHSLLQWQGGESNGQFSDFDLPESLKARAAKVRSRDAGDSKSLFQSRVQSLLWVAAAVLLLGLFGIVQFSDSRQSAQTAVAQIVEHDGVQWTGDVNPLSSEGSVYPGRLQCEAGTFTMQFRSGPVVQVTAPVSMMIESDMLIHLDRGQATAKVPEQAIGFAIKTPVIDVIDQGTEFGVAVGNSGHTDVVVFDGKVDLADSIGDSGVSQRLTRGQAARVDRHGSIDRLADIRRDIKGGWWSGDLPDASRNLISRVTDNIGGSSEVYACYQTTSLGLQDDALAYSDNPNHQWNGLTSAGLPQFLLGADYIRTFNDYRYRLDFRVTIELSRPANLYVLADNRIPPPAWLLEKFEDTGIDIGLDEGPWLDNVEPEFRELDVNTTAVGAGKSIDNEFSVWLRRCVDGQPIELGSAGKWGEGEEGRAMYGIAATPLDIETLE